MEKLIAEILIGQLEKHEGLLSLDNELFLDILVLTKVTESSKFYKNIPDNKQSVQKAGSYHHFSLQRLLNNKNAVYKKISLLKKAYETITAAFSAYFSDALSENLQTDSVLVEMIKNCKEPYSLLGKFQTHDYKNPNGRLFIITQPVLVIPGIVDMRYIYDWEKANTYHQEEVGLILKHKKRIDSSIYLSQ
jgi:hypothetical protein